MKVVTAEQMRIIDRTAAEAGLTTEILMENAGRAIARETVNLLGSSTGNILILIGPGNNGGDGLVAARYLQEAGAHVTLYLCSKRSSEDKNYRLTQEKHISTLNVELDSNFARLEEQLSVSQVVIDSLFGTGRSRAIEGNFKQVITKVNDAKQKRPELFVIAADVPSGLDANTGVIDSACVSADATITLGYPKPGLYNFPGAEKAGKIIIADIGIPPTLAEDISVELLTGGWVKSVLPKRPASANKGTFGKLLVVSGSINYIGAAYLACMGAARVGTGLVTLGTTKSLQSILATKLTEVTYIPLPESSEGTINSEATSILQSHLSNYDVLLLGCGLGNNPNVLEFIKTFLFSLTGTRSIPLILDADALNALAQIPNWWQKLNKDVILTPHPGEMSRLTGLPLTQVQQDRLGIAQQTAAKWQKIVVLKGAYTIIASPDGQSKICQEANPGLASAGTGDVLSGIIAGLGAQGLSPFNAACCGVYIHAQAGNFLRKEMGDTGILASDLLPVLPKILKATKEGCLN
jgi:ADP-dependent NAD(P)H-hydrate dehydratase / NAD(P)H-hydrate epimerase